jgi:hypothetical protein
MDQHIADIEENIFNHKSGIIVLREGGKLRNGSEFSERFGKVVNGL